MKVLELYSGIGGMHYSLKESGVKAEVVLAADINNVANLVYKHNFPDVKVYNKSILSMTPTFIDQLGVDMILMSPPCQPYTRLGKQEDIADRRSDSLSHLIDVIPKVSQQLQFILLENVKGFEKSESRKKLLESLKPSFSVLEFILNPNQFGIPNSRDRYYLLARRKPFTLKLHPEMISDPSILCQPRECFSINEILEMHDDSVMYDEFLVSEDVLFKRALIMDIVTKEDKRSCCFTKAYARYIEGTGSVYSSLDRLGVSKVLQNVKVSEEKSKKFKLLKSLQLRFFSPKEVSNLMCFPSDFTFPNSVTQRQKYKLLGNSINVKVVSHLITYLFHS